MALGEAIKQDFTLILNDPSQVVTTLDVGGSTVDDCCFSLPALAKLSGGDEFTDDKSSVIFFYDAGFTSATMKLQKYINGIWTDQNDLNDNTYGTYYAYGFEVNTLEENLMGYLLDWNLILNALGEGSYRVKTIDVPVIGSNLNQFSIEWCLLTYTAARANETVRFDWYNEGIIGNNTDDTKVRDYGTLSYFNQMRLPESTFGQNTSEYEREYVRYQNGRQVWLTDEQVESYTFISGRFPSFVHNIIKSDILQAETIEVTAYNKNAANEITKKAVIADGSYEPEWNTGTKLAKVEFTFKQLFQNHKHKRC